MLAVSWNMKGLITIDFLKKMSNCKHCFLLPNVLPVFHLIYGMTHVYQNISDPIYPTPPLGQDMTQGQ